MTKPSPFYLLSFICVHAFPSLVLYIFNLITSHCPILDDQFLDILIFYALKGMPSHQCITHVHTIESLISLAFVAVFVFQILHNVLILDVIPRSFHDL
jgi:hypothetical protein